MALFDWYSYGQDKAVAGMKADSTVDVVDSYASEGAIAVGKAVELGTDPAKQVKASVTAANVIGISIFEQKVDASPLYPDEYAVPVMTFGDVWVEVAEAVTAGDAVYLSTEGAFGSSTGSAVTGMTYLTSAGVGELAIVRIRK
jgi:hypothetical protein